MLGLKMQNNACTFKRQYLNVFKCLSLQMYSWAKCLTVNSIFALQKLTNLVVAFLAGMNMLV